MHRTIARALVVALVVASPGFQPYQAVAQTIAGSASGAGVSVVVPVPTAGLAAPSAPLVPVSGLSAAATLAPAPALAAVVTPAKLAPAQAVAARAAAALAAKVSRAAARTPGAAASTVLSQAAQPITVKGSEASESSADSAGRPFEGSAGRSAAEAVEGSLGLGGPIGLTRPQESISAGDIAVSMPSPSIGERAARWSARPWVKSAAIGVVAAAGVLLLNGMAPAALTAGLGFAAAAPFLFGGLSSTGEPEGDNLKKFQAELARTHKAGDVIADSAARDAARAAGITVDKANIALLRLSEGEAVHLPSGRWLYLGLSSQQDLGAYGTVSALEGLRLFKGSKWQEHLRAVALLEDAAGKLAKGRRETRAPSPMAAAVQNLKGNAYLQTLAELGKVMANRAAKDGRPQEQQLLNQAAEWARTSYFARGHIPAMMDAAPHRALVAAFGETRIDFGNEADALDMTAAFKAVKAFSESVGPEEPVTALVPVAKSEAPQRPSAENWLIGREDSRYQNLNKYGVNLSRLATEDSPEIPKLIGRRKEIRQMVKTLLRVEKNNPLVIGEKGVGKTAVVKGMARLIAEGEIPQLEGKNIYKLDMNAVLAGTTLRGQFEERMQAIINEAKASKGQIILFIDEIHAIVGLGEAQGAPHDASQILKEALSTGELALIGATTMKELRVIEKDEALARRFNPVKLDVPTLSEAIEIVEGVKGRYEKKHKVKVGAETVEASVRLAARYITERNLPDSALDLLDDASTEVEMRAYESKAEGQAEGARDVTPDDIAFEIALRTGIPANSVSSDDLEALKRLPGELQTEVIGQDESIDGVVRAIRRGRLGYKEAKQPVGTFVFLGPTGVGKTEVARVLARTQFKSEKNIVRIDMSEYQEKHSVSRLIGAPPGYVGHDGPGLLTEPVRRNPHTVVLLDEIEKAAPEVLDVLLQVIEDGRLTDGQGHTVDFSNVILIMTSNIGGSEAYAKKKNPMGFAAQAAPAHPVQDRKQGYLDAFKAAVKPEFFNRIGRRRVVVFNELGRTEIEKILDLRLKDLNIKVASRNLAVRITDAARLHLLDEATSAENRVYGARPIKQAIENEVEDALVDGELAKRIGPGDRVLVDYDASTGAFAAKKDTDGTVSMGGWAVLIAAASAAAMNTTVAIPIAAAFAAAIGTYLVFRALKARAGLLPDAQGPPKSGLLAAGLRIGAMAAVFLALDWGIKFALVQFGLPIVFHDIVPGRALLLKFSVPMSFVSAAYFMSLAHSRKGPAQWIESLQKKHPAAAAVLKLLLSILLFPIGLGEKRFVGDLAEKSPAIRKLVKVADIAIAGMIAAALGNGLEGLVNGRVVDFIPFGHARANLADMLIFFGMPLLWMTLDFFGAARKALETRQPAQLPSWKYYLMPLLGVAAFVLSTAAGYALVPAAAWYVLLFSSLFGLGVLASDAFLQGRVAEFNRAFRPTDSAGAKVAPVAPRLSFGYRAKKRVAALLASLGLAVGAPRLSPGDYEVLVERYREAPPKLVILDYDDTFLDNSDGKGLIVTPERIALLEKLAAARIRVAFATNRPLDGGTYAMSHMLMEKLPEALRKNFIVSTGGGAEVYQYGPNGEKPEAAARSNPLSEEEFAGLKRVLREEASKLGLSEYREDGKGYEYAAIFKPGENRVRELFPLYEKAVRKAGYDFNVTLKAFDDDPKKRHLEPYIRVSKSSKTMAVKGILELVAAEGSRLEPEDVVMIGDDYTTPGFDSAMARALPQGAALAVGKGADPKLANVYLLPEVGPEQTVDFLNKLVR